MSLKVFHLIFIALSVLMAATVGGWGIHRYLAAGGTRELVLGVAFFVAGAGLVVYGLRVLRKFREMGG